MTFSPFLLIVSAAVLFTSVYILYILFFDEEKKKRRSVKLPPGPATLPVIGNLHQLVGSLNHKSIESLSKQYGPVMLLQLGAIPTIVISSTDVVRDIVKTNDLTFSGRPKLYVANRLSYNCSCISFAPYGDYWRKVRKIAILELLSSKRIQSFKQVREEEMNATLDSIARLSTSPVNFNEQTFLLVNNVVSRIIFGKKYSDGEENEFDKVLHQIQELLGEDCLSDYFPWMSSWVNKFSGLEARVEKNFRKLDKLYDQVMQDHLDPKRSKLEHEDFVDVLLRIKRDSSNETALTDEQIKGILSDLFIAGTDTSSSTLVWTMTELIKNPLAMKRVQEEVRGAVNSEKEIVEEDDLSKLIYLKLVIKESLRLHPPVPFLVPRETMEETHVMGYAIPSKTRVLIDAKSIGKEPKYWENSSEFKPERFLDNSIDFRGQHFEFIPFGVGRRGCPGINFGVLLIELILANLLYRFNWELPDGITRDDVDMEEVFGLAVFKKTPLLLVPKTLNISNIALL